MGVVHFPRDGAGRIIVDPNELDAQVIAGVAPSAPAAPEMPRPVRAISPASRAAPALPEAVPLITWQSAAITAVLLLLAALVVVVMAHEIPARPLVGRPTAPPVAPTAAPPTVTSFGAPLDAAIVAYFDFQQPDTATALDRDTRVQPIARIGHAWLQLQLASGTAVWVRWRDLPAPGAALDQLPDLAPPPTPLPTDPPTAAPAPIYAPQPTIDTRPVSCVTTEAGQLCRRGLDAHDADAATAIAATSQAYNAPFQQAYDATATAVSGR